jgi:hypothetical protein
VTLKLEVGGRPPGFGHCGKTEGWAKGFSLMPLALQQGTPTVLEKSSVAELPLNLTWDIYAFSGSFAALRMTGRF